MSDLFQRNGVPPQRPEDIIPLGRIGRGVVQVTDTKEVIGENNLRYTVVFLKGVGEQKPEQRPFALTENFLGKYFGRIES